MISTLASWAIAASPAAAEYRHVNVAAEFGSDGTSATSFASVNSLAYQQATHRLFVLDAGGSVFGFDRPSPGTLTPLGGLFPISTPGIGADPDLAVDNTSGVTAGSLYLAKDSPTFSSYSSSGSPLATVYNGGSELCGLAVDNTGHIWAGHYQGGGSALEFTAGSSAIGKTVDTSSGAANPCKVAIDQSNNDLYVSSYSSAGVWQYTAASGYATAKRIGQGLGSNNRVVVNGAKHAVYIGGPNFDGKIRAFSTVTGELLETIEPPGTAIRGLAVDEATDTLFVASANTNKILEMRAILAPKVTTGEPVAETVVGGTTDPDGAGSVTECYFEFGTTTEYGSKEDCDQSLPIEAATAVTATLPGLAHETTYHYRLVVATATPGTVIKGNDQTIRLQNVKKLKTEMASKVTRTSAQLNASFEGSNEETTYYFEYGTSAAYGSRFPLAPSEEVAAPSTGPVSISVPISGLVAGTAYHFHVVAENSQGVTLGDDMEFKALPAVNAVLTEAATGVTKTTATLNGSYDGATNDTPPGPLESFHYYFEWGETGAYGNTTAIPPGDEGGAHAEIIHVSAPIAGLAPNLPGSSPYHYRLVVSNSFGTTYGPDMTLTTQPPDLPQVSDVRTEGIQPTSATVAASINPSGIVTTYAIEYGTSTKYSDTTQVRSLGAGDSDQPISVPLAGLLPGTEYHYRILATNSSGTTAIPDQVFTTPNAPVIESSDVSAGMTSAHLTVSVIANGRPTRVHFEYGGSASYGSATAPAELGPSLLAQPVGVELSGLQPGTTYHFRGIATNEIGTAIGADQTFTTQPAPLLVEKGRSKACKKAFVRHRGKCVRKHKKHRKHKKRSRHRPSS